MLATSIINRITGLAFALICLCGLIFGTPEMVFADELDLKQAVVLAEKSKVRVRFLAERREQTIVGEVVQLSHEDFPNTLAVRSVNGYLHVFDLESVQPRIERLDDETDLNTVPQDVILFSVRGPAIKHDEKMQDFLLHHQRGVERVRRALFSAIAAASVTGMILYGYYIDGNPDRPLWAAHLSNAIYTAVPISFATLSTEWTSIRLDEAHRSYRHLYVLAAAMALLNAIHELPFQPDYLDFQVGTATAVGLALLPKTAIMVSRQIQRLKWRSFGLKCSSLLK